MSTHVTFLEDEYMTNFKPKSRFSKKNFEEKVILGIFHKEKLKDYLRIRLRHIKINNLESLIVVRGLLDK